MVKVEGFVIVGPVSPWDELHREAIESWTATSCFGTTEVDTWRKFVGKTVKPDDFGERVQFWYDRGYRIRKATLAFEEHKDG